MDLLARLMVHDTLLAFDDRKNGKKKTVSKRLDGEKSFKLYVNKNNL
jgi:hypothetical protein